MGDSLEGYAAAANAELIARFDALSPAEIYAPVSELLPKRPVRVADIGAGTGRDAAWFARRGHTVLAVEPVDEFRKAGAALHGSPNIEWLDDSLPALARVQAWGQFDLVTLCAVWHHLADGDRAVAIRNLARVTTTGGRLILSLRHGPGVVGRGVFPVVAEQTIEWARQAGFRLTRRCEAGSVQPGNRATGVRWTWLALDKAE